MSTASMKTAAPKRWRKGRRMIGLKYVFVGLGALMYATVLFVGDKSSESDLSSPTLPFASRSLLSSDDNTERRLNHFHADSNASDSHAPTTAPTKSPTGETTDLMSIDYFSMEQKKNGAIILHIWCILSMFYGIAVLCDNYFEPALEVLCEKLDLQEDVAGATFMAAGGSAPELATSMLGVFVTKSDVGIGTIVGSAVFNVLFVIAVCAIAAPNLELTWWPLARDCSYYCMSILVLTVVILDNKVEWGEALGLLCMYLIYVIIMANNKRLNNKVEWHVRNHDLNCRPKICQVIANFCNHTAFDFFIYAVIILNLVASVGYPDQPIPDFINLICALIYIVEFLLKTYGLGFVGFWLDAMNALDGMLVILIIVELVLSASEDGTSSGGTTASTARTARTARLFRFFRVIRILRVIRLYRTFYTSKAEAYTQTTPRLMAETPEEQLGQTGRIRRATVQELQIPLDLAATPASKLAGAKIAAKVVPIEAIEETPVTAGPSEEGEEEDDDGPFDPFEIPEDSLSKFIWAANLPLVLIMYCVIPDCKREGKEWLYPVTFINCILTIAVLAYMMVWMATLFGKVANIPDAVMGLTFLAAGTSIPDALSSLAVARRGFGDMAVSSSVGSNIFDILIGLPVPWILKTAMVDPGSSVEIKSDGIAIMIITLFIMVALVVLSISAFNWRLVKKLGYIYMMLYIVFVVESLLLEYDVF